VSWLEVAVWVGLVVVLWVGQAVDAVVHGSPLRE